MPMTDDQFKELLNNIASGTNKALTGSVATKLDNAFPLPIGTKSITGLLGAITGFAALYFGLVPADEVTGKIVELAVMAFTSLGGLGLISKFQRYVNIGEKSLETSLEILRQLKEQARAEGA